MTDDDIRDAVIQYGRAVRDDCPNTAHSLLEHVVSAVEALRREAESARLAHLRANKYANAWSMRALASEEKLRDLGLAAHRCQCACCGATINTICGDR